MTAMLRRVLDSDIQIQLSYDMLCTICDCKSGALPLTRPVAGDTKPGHASWLYPQKVPYRGQKPASRRKIIAIGSSEDIKPLP